MRRRLISTSACAALLLLFCGAEAAPQQEQVQAAVAESARNFHFETFFYQVNSGRANEYTAPVGVNDEGVIIGNIYRQFAGGCPQLADCGTEGFIYENRQFRLLTGPLYNGHFTRPIAINNRGQILLVQENRAALLNHHDQYFIYDVKGKSFRPMGALVQVAGSPAPIWMVQITGFNDRGQIVGFYRYKGKLWGAYGQPILGEAGSTVAPMEGAALTPIECPEGRSTRALGLNNRGQITGSCEGGNRSPTRRGFLFEKGTMTLFDVPGAMLTRGNAINDAGVIVGEYTLKPLHPGNWPVMAFAYDGAKFVQVDVHGAPNGLLSQATGINNRGQIAGMDGDGNQGFLATPASANPLRRSER